MIVPCIFRILPYGVRRVLLTRLIIPSAVDPARRGSGSGPRRQGGALHWTNDLDAVALACSVCSGSMADGMVRYPSYPKPGITLLDHLGAGVPPPETCSPLH